MWYIETTTTQTGVTAVIFAWHEQPPADHHAERISRTYRPAVAGETMAVLNTPTRQRTVVVVDPAVEQGGLQWQEPRKKLHKRDILVKGDRDR